MITFVFKAQPTGDQDIPDLDIRGRTPFPGDHVDYQAATDHHQAQADLIANALHASLPGGTWDRLVATMVAKHATILRVRR